MKAKSFHLSKKGLAMEVAGEIGRVFECVSDKIPPAYPCENEKVLFVTAEMNGHVDKAVESLLKDLTPVRAKNVIFVTINKDGNTNGLENITKTLEDKGIHVAGKYGVAASGGFFSKKVAPEDVRKVIDWAKGVLETELK